MTSKIPSASAELPASSMEFPCACDPPTPMKGRPATSAPLRSRLCLQCASQAEPRASASGFPSALMCQRPIGTPLRSRLVVGSRCVNEPRPRGSGLSTELVVKKNQSGRKTLASTASRTALPVQLVYYGFDLFLGYSKFFSLFVQFLRSRRKEHASEIQRQLTIRSGKKYSRDFTMLRDDHRFRGTQNISRPVSEFMLSLQGIPI